jgi:hypothetical protein
MSVVVVIDIDHQAAQQVANLVCNFNLKLIQLTRLEVISDVVVRQEGSTRFPQALTDAAEIWGFKLPLPLPLATPLETKGTVEVMVFVQKAPAAGIRVRSSINWLLGCNARFASVSAA